MAVEDCESAKHRAIRELILSRIELEFLRIKKRMDSKGSVLFSLLRDALSEMHYFRQIVNLTAMLLALLEQIQYNLSAATICGRRLAFSRSTENFCLYRNPAREIYEKEGEANADD